MGAAKLPNNLTIREVAIRFGVTLRTLRFYEEKGLLSPARYNQERFYSGQDLNRLQVILTGKRLGFSLEEIRRLIDERLQSKAPATGPELLSLSKEEIEARIRILTEKSDTLTQAIDELRTTLD